MLPPITYRTFVHAPRAEVFEAMATADGWNAWFTDDARIEPRAGGRCWFRWTQFGPDHVNLELEATVLLYEPTQEFAFEWPSGTQRTQVSLHLDGRARGTIVEVTEHGYSSTDGQVRACLDCACGWGEALTLAKFYVEHGVTYGRVPAG